MGLHEEQLQQLGVAQTPGRRLGKDLFNPAFSLLCSIFGMLELAFVAGFDCPRVKEAYSSSSVRLWMRLWACSN